jgi:hypothetical protein
VNCERGTPNCLMSGQQHHCYVMTTEQMLAELRENRSIIGSVNEALNRAGIHCALTFTEAIRQIAQDRDHWKNFFEPHEKTLLRECVSFRISELREALDMALRRGQGAMLQNMRVTGQQAELELVHLFNLRDKLK